MPTLTTRAATPAQVARKYEHLSWFERGRRRLAREEAAFGQVEEVSFTVSRAWKLFSCAGAPCCPNEWLLETSDGDFVQVDSWSSLQPTESGCFPGRFVTATRWPKTNRLIDASIAGDPITTENAEVEVDVLNDLANQYVECRVLRRADLPEGVRRVVDRGAA
jgi:hypothetical protein